MKQFVEDINKIIKESKENVSILIKELNSKNDIYNYNSDVKVVAASLIKVPIMLAILDEVKNKNIHLNDNIFVTNEDILEDTEVFANGEKNYSIYELLNWMIIVSDNTAANILIKKIGIKKINEYIKNTLKLKSTELQRYMLDKNAINNGINNYTSQKDMFNVFELLFSKKILNKELCDLAIEILYNQQINNQIMRYIYKPVKYAHKTGSLDYLNHDVGVMNINEKLFYIGVSVYNSNKKEGNKELVGIIGKIVYEYLK